MSKLPSLFALLLLLGAPTFLRAADGDDIKGMRIEPADTSVAVIGKARLTVDPLVRGEGGMHAPYKVDVSNLPTGGEAGQFKIVISEVNFGKLAAQQSFNFTGSAVSKDGNESDINGTVTPSSADGGEVKIKVISKRGKLVFHTTYQLTR